MSRNNRDALRLAYEQIASLGEYPGDDPDKFFMAFKLAFAQAERHNEQAGDIVPLDIVSSALFCWISGLDVDQCDPACLGGELFYAFACAAAAHEAEVEERLA